MRFRISALHLLACLITPIVAGQTAGPPVKGLWVLPTLFKTDGKADDPAKVDQQKFAAPGKKFLEAFKSQAGGLEPLIREGPHATRDEVLSKTKQILDSLKPGSIFVFYYGGHGVQPGPPSTMRGRRGTTYLALQNCEIGDGPPTFSQMVAVDEIMNLQAQYEHIYFFGFIDACFSGTETFNSRQVFRSDALGSRGFLLCSSGSDRKSYSDAFTSALIKIYNTKELFDGVTSPPALLDQVLKVGDFLREQIPKLIPASNSMQVIYPLPGLSFCTISFGGSVKNVVHVTVTPPAGKRVFFRFNEPLHGEDVGWIGSVSFPIQQLDGTTIVVGLSTKEQPPIKVDARGKPYIPLTVKLPGATLIAAKSPAEQVATAQEEFRTLVARAKAFGLADNEVVNVAKSTLQSQVGGKLDASLPFVVEQLTFVAQTAPTAADTPALRLLAGLDPVDKGGINEVTFATLDRVAQLGVPADEAAFASTYAKHIEKNVALAASGSKAAYIEPKYLTEKFQTGAALANMSESKEAKVALAKALQESQNGVLSSRDYKIIRGSLIGHQPKLQQSF